jgi:hypothetical protein
MAYSQNIDRIGYHDLEGRVGFKLAMREAGGHFFLYVASMWEPGLFILDVTDAENPEFVRFIAGPPNTWCLQVQVAGDRMITKP